MKTVKTLKRFLQKSSNRQNFIDAAVENQCANVEEKGILPYSKLPGPKPLPLLGNTWRFIPFIGDFQIEKVHEVSKKLHEKYGKIVKMEGLLGRPDMVFLFDPDEIERVYRREDVMPYRPSMPSLNYYKHVYRKDFFGEQGGVIAVHGEQWQNFRSKVNHIMLQPRLVKQYVSAMDNIAQEFVDRIANLLDDTKEVPEDFLNDIHKWSLESIAKVALDVRLGCLNENPSAKDTQKLIDAVTTFFMLVPVLELKIPFWRLFNTPVFIKYIEALDTIRSICMKYIEESLNNLNTNDDKKEVSILQRILRTENNPKVASILALDLFLVGIDTTSNAVASIMYQLAKHQEKQDILSEEIRNFLPETSTPITSEKLERMAYLRACIKETLRMYPVVIGNGRQTTTDNVIAGYHIPKNVQIIFQHYVISNDDKYFLDATKFLPERWLKSCPLSKGNHPFATLPFGFGKRMCLGRRFADLEIQSLIAKVIRNYKIEYHYGDLGYHIHPMFTPNGPLKLRFLPRQ